MLVEPSYRSPMHSWCEKDRPVRLLEKSVPKGEAKALACYGLWLSSRERMLLRFAEKRPVSGVTKEFLGWVSQELYQEGTRALFMVWDNASWHISNDVRAWIRDHNRRVKARKKEGVRLIVCQLPTRSPWLNPIEPKWVHGKRNVAEPDTVLDCAELTRRVHQHFSCLAHPLLPTEAS